jgi:hypothetical protein
MWMKFYYLKQGFDCSHKVIGKTNLLKNVGNPEYYLGGNVELIGEACN